MLIRMLDSPSLAQRRLESRRLVTLGGAPVPPELVRRAREQGVKGAIGFGQTEASPYLTHTLPDDPHPDWISTVGRPMAQTEIKIVSTETGAIVPVGEIGEKWELRSSGFRIATGAKCPSDLSRSSRGKRSPSKNCRSSVEYAWPLTRSRVFGGSSINFRRPHLARF